MSLSAFPYVGGKYYYADWVTSHFPGHQLYVEPFGGGASVLLNKEPSHREVYNDVNNRLVTFFRLVQTRTQELQERLEGIPFAKSLHDEWTHELYTCEETWPDEWPDDEIERAARWFFLRFTQYGAKLNGPSGFKRPTVRNEARTYRNAIPRLERVALRINEITLECDDYLSILDRYDSPDTLFYLDPPYVDKGVYYNARGFDHAELAAALADLEARWLCSYHDLPPELEAGNYHVAELSATVSLNVIEGVSRDRVTERLAMNFDPTETEPFRGAQRGLEAFVNGEEPRGDGR